LKERKRGIPGYGPSLKNRSWGIYGSRFSEDGRKTDGSCQKISTKDWTSSRIAYAQKSKLSHSDLLELILQKSTGGPIPPA
jgi:hypothetical protein